jgi:hypothetical protein
MPELQKDEKLIKEYCRRLLSDPVFTTLEVLGMREGIALEEASFRLQLIEAGNINVQSRGATQFSRIEWEAWVSEVAHASSSASNADALRQPGKTRPLSPIQALTTGRRMVVVGDQGSGKTTLLRWLAAHAARADTPDLPDLPVLLSLNDYHREGNDDLIEFIARKLGVSRSSIEERLRRGQLLLLCDGLDEAGRGEQFGQERLYQQLEVFASQYPQVLIVVACRRAAWRRGLRGFYAAELCDLSWEDAQDIIRKWFAKNPEAGRDLSRRLLQNFGLRAMASSPLLLSLICTVYERQAGRLPFRRAELYSQCIMYLRSRNKGTGTLRRLTISQEIEILGHFALYLHRHYTRELSRREALTILRANLPGLGLEAEEAENVLLSLTSGQGLLRHQTESVYGFVHLSLQEFFAAEALAKGGRQLLNILVPHLFDDWWREVILLLAGIGDATPLLELIWGKRNLGSPAVLLACYCLGEEPHLLDPGLSMGVMTATMQLILEAGSDYAVKAQAINALASVRHKETVGYLSALLPRSDIGRFLDWELYGRVIETLVQLNDRVAISTAFTCLRRDELDDEQKLRLIDALAAVGNWEQVLTDFKIILPALKGDPKAKVLLLLTQNGDRSAVGKALQILNDPYVDDNLKARLLPSLAKALEGNGPRDPILTGHIYKLLQDGPRLGLGLRLKLVDFAIQRGGAARLLELIRFKPYSFEQELRRRIIIASTRFGGPEVLPRLLALLDEAESPELRRQSIAAIIAIATSEQADQILNYLRGNTSHINEYTTALAFLTEELLPGKKTRAVTQRFLRDEPDFIPERPRRETSPLRPAGTGTLRSSGTGPLRRWLEPYRTLAHDLSKTAAALPEASVEPYQYVYNMEMVAALSNGPR